MAIYNYQRFKIRVSPESKKRQGLLPGDIVRRQYTDGELVRYSLMAVLETGTETVTGPNGEELLSPFFIGALLDGDEPHDGELLDFVRVTSLTDLSRSGALYLTASDDESPYLDVISGMGNERSLCRPSGTGLDGYAWMGETYLDGQYTDEVDGATRLIALRRNATPAGNATFGIRQLLPLGLSHPQRIVISFRVLSTEPKDGIPLSIGFTDGSAADCITTFDVGKEWSYKIIVITLDSSSTAQRALTINLTNHLTKEDDAFILADLNVVLLSDLSDYPAASKARVGRISGIVDPLFGTLEGYGAYFQNLYATKNINVAGTLTAGDEQGFASTFYVGRIHKNCCLNSLTGNFKTQAWPAPNQPTPAGIGVASVLFMPSTVLECQSETWTQIHADERYCFSFWGMSPDGDVNLKLSYNERELGVFLLAREWKRFHMAFNVEHKTGQNLCITFNGGVSAIACYQLEAGERPTFYQPTNDILNETDEYGAWFSRGGIGGTIQNPLLKLNDDGSIRSANGSFVINADGTGYFAGGKFKWNKEQIELTGLTLDWAEIAQHVPQLDWVEQWNTGKTHIGAELVVTPKIFAGTKDESGLATGVALGKFPMSMYNDDDTELVVRDIEGIAGFDRGRKVFSMESSGNVSFGYGAESIRYNAVTGKIEFGAGVSLQWVGATYINAEGMFTGTLSASTVNAIMLNASQITSGIIDAARIDTESLKASILTADNIEALTLNVTQGKIGGWIIDRECIYRGTKKNTIASFTDNLNDITIGSMGIRGRKWRLDSLGSGAIAGGNINWDITGKVNFASSVSLNWESGIDAAQELARSMAFGKMLYRVPEFFLDGAVHYNNTGDYLNYVTRSIERVRDCPNSTGYALKCVATDWHSPTDYRIGGFNFLGNQSRANAVFMIRIIALIPLGRSIQIYHNLYGNEGTSKWLTSNAGTGQWEEYICKVVCGKTGTFDIINHFALDGGEAPTAVVPVTWYIAFATVFDVTAAEKYTTTIDGNGIYTGSLTAGQITAGMLSADRIAAGSITSEKLDAVSIKASIINTDYINGLSCNFTQGKIGGWTIGADFLREGTKEGIMGSPSIHLRTKAGGSPTGNWHLGEYLPRGLEMIWHHGANAGHLVFGEVAETRSSVKTGFIGIQMMDYLGNEYFCFSANADRDGSRETYCQLAGWKFDYESIWKNNVALGADGSITNEQKWRLNNDGSGQIANGNIQWNAAGDIAFSPSVSLSWKNDIQTAKTTDYGFAYKKDIIIYGNADLFYPVVIKGGDQTVKREIMVRRSFNEQGPESWNPSIPSYHGSLSLTIKTNFGGWGGVSYSWDIYELAEQYSRMFAGAQQCGNLCMFAIFLRGGGDTGAVYHLYSDQPLINSAYSPNPIPPSPQICYDSDLIFDYAGSKAYASAPRTLSAAVEEEIRKHRFIALAQGADTTLTQHPLTYIGSTGIYTGTLTAAQVNAVSINAGSISTGTLSTDRLDAGSIKANIINTSYINGLSCTFTQGKIGGWSITGDSLSAGSVYSTATTFIQLRPTSIGSGYWANGEYKPFGMSLYWFQTGNAGHVVVGQIAATGNTPKSGFVGIQMMAWDNTEYFCLSANYTRTGSKEVYNRIAGWAFDHNHIWKNSVSLGADGSISNAAKWQFNNDGSGRLASGNISWDAAGNVTFGASVALNWTNSTQQGRIYIRGTCLNRNDARIVKVNGVHVVNQNSRGLTLTVLDRYTLNLIESNNYDVYGNEDMCHSLASALGGVASNKIIILTSFDAIRINARLNEIIQNCGGPDMTITDVRLPFAMLGIQGIGKNNGLVSFSGTGASDPFAEISTVVIDGLPQGVNCSGQRMTHISAYGIYTGTIKASQVVIDSTLVVGGGTYNGSISVRDASNNVKVTLDRSGIGAYAGTIGGWTINANRIYSGTVALDSSGAISNGNKWMLNTDGSGQLASGNLKWDNVGNVSMTGTINANGGTIGGFTISTNRIGSTAVGGSSSGGGLAIYDNLFRVGNTVSYAMFGDNTYPSIMGGISATGRIVNAKTNPDNWNYGLYLDVYGAEKNFGLYTHTPLLAAAFINSRVSPVYFSGTTYKLDFATDNLFFIYSDKNYSVNLPDENSVAYMFNLSSLPPYFAFEFTFVYNYYYGNQLTFDNIRDNNGALRSVSMAKGDVMVLMCARFPYFHYQLINLRN